MKPRQLGGPGPLGLLWQEKNSLTYVTIESLNGRISTIYAIIEFLVLK